MSIQSVAVPTLDQLGAEEGGDEEAPRFSPDKEGFVEIVWGASRLAPIEALRYE